MKRYFTYLMPLLVLAACNKTPGPDAGGQNVINIGGLSVPELSISMDPVSKANAPARYHAEDMVWLQGALREGLDITYSNMVGEQHNIGNEQVAILKWLGTKDPDSGRGKYSFNYKINGQPAVWYQNGLHYFEGQYVPADIRVPSNTPELSPAAANLSTDQRSDLDKYNPPSGQTVTQSGNYTLLSHYIAMPANWTTSATIDQVLLPFKHRLSRVIAYVLIDPILEAKIEGYASDPSNAMISFDNVKVLDKVLEETANAGGAPKLTPKWRESRSVKPHFLKAIGETADTKGSRKFDGTLAYTGSNATAKAASDEFFIIYLRKKDDKILHPGEEGWVAAHEDFYNGHEAGYEQKKYNTIPIYDIIVRPTYTSEDKVMYDEDGYYNADKTVNTAKLNEYLNQKNSINFSLALDNGLEYEKLFPFDLDANMQTIVYLTVDREGVDYDSSETMTWDSTERTDAYYGVNNDLGHNLSIVGSSWQRAMINNTTNYDVTDGNQYGGSQDGVEVHQYVTDAVWIQEFAKAVKGGDRHGNYFVLERDITIPASALPESFVFTGHLDARGHTITLTGSRASLFTGLNAIYETRQENGQTPWEANVHKEGSYWVPFIGYRAELLNAKLSGGTFFPADAVFSGQDIYNPSATVTGYVYNCHELDASPANLVENIVPLPTY